MFRRFEAWKSDPKELGDIEVDTIGCVVKGSKVPSCEKLRVEIDQSFSAIKRTYSDVLPPLVDFNK